VSFKERNQPGLPATSIFFSSKFAGFRVNKPGYEKKVCGTTIRKKDSLNYHNKLAKTVQTGG
jgi:hypothetical protein